MGPNKAWGPNKIWGPGIDLRTPWKIFSLRPCPQVLFALLPLSKLDHLHHGNLVNQEYLIWEFHVTSRNRDTPTMNWQVPDQEN